MDSEVPTVTILILGDAEVGKSTFLSRLTLGRNVEPAPSPSSSSSSSSPDSDPVPPYALPTLRDLDQPFAFDVRLYARHYRLNFHDTASPTHYTLLRPDFILLAYDVSRRATLASVREHWAPLVHATYDVDGARIPVMVVGLKRDLRREWTDGDRASVMPQEGLGAAQALRVDRYAECSAVTGELCAEVLEDVARTAAKTTTEKGGLSEGACGVM